MRKPRVVLFTDTTSYNIVMQKRVLWPCTGPDRAPISTLLACGRVHHHLVTNKKRMLAGLLLETGEARDVHHMCTLIGYGADAICPYLAMEAIVALQEDGKVDGRASRLDLINSYIKVHALTWQNQPKVDCVLECAFYQIRQWHHIGSDAAFALCQLVLCCAAFGMPLSMCCAFH